MPNHPAASADPTSTRDRVIAELRRGDRSVEQIAKAVGTTRNAVRSHLAALERDGLVRGVGVRRGGGVGKPAALYALTVDAELMLSRAYPTVLSAVIDTLVTKLDGPHAELVLRDVGARLAATMGGEAHGTLRHRVDAAAAALISLGGDVEVAEDGEALMIRGFGCPLAKSVSDHPETCRAVRAMVHHVTGAHTEEKCEHGHRPQCRFRVSEG